AKRSLLAFKEQPFYYSEVKHLGVLSIIVRGAPELEKNHRQIRRCQQLAATLLAVQGQKFH
ncbi:hypothetical protein NL439_25600, partial [Klebsiella pneumoniae]|nr:hypothetical protein [Klebsiella pneumoniae]